MKSNKKQELTDITSLTANTQINLNQQLLSGLSTRQYGRCWEKAKLRQIPVCPLEADSGGGLREKEA